MKVILPLDLVVGRSSFMLFNFCYNYFLILSVAALLS